jgi:hypothetical protein
VSLPEFFDQSEPSWEFFSSFFFHHCVAGSGDSRASHQSELVSGSFHVI